MSTARDCRRNCCPIRPLLRSAEQRRCPAGNFIEISRLWPQLVAARCSGVRVHGLFLPGSLNWPNTTSRNRPPGIKPRIAAVDGPEGRNRNTVAAINTPGRSTASARKTSLTQSKVQAWAKLERVMLFTQSVDNDVDNFVENSSDTGIHSACSKPVNS